MVPPNKKSSHNLPLKIISLLFGYTFWHIFGNIHTATAWITIPLCFYNVPEQKQIKAPEAVSVKVAGKRSILRSLDMQELAIHVNASQLNDGKNLLHITPETIFLPQSIKVVHYSPSNPMVKLEAKTKA